MGYGDNRRTPKMKRRRGKLKKKARLARRAAEAGSARKAAGK